MNRNSNSAVGALHPILFFLIVYGISLFLAFFVCRTVYFTFNGSDAEKENETAKNVQPGSSALAASAASAVVYK